MAASVPTTTADVVAAHDRLSQYIFGHFRRKLTFEEARDAAAEALAEADRAIERGHDIQSLDRWLKRAAWNNALDLIRKHEGEGETPRQRPVDVADCALAAAGDDHVDLVEDDARAADARALERAWSSLKPDEQRALHLRYYDEQPVEQVLELLACTRHHYENLTKRGLRKLRQALVQAVAHDACRACRALTLQAQDQPLQPLAAAERDAHLDSCLACRAFARRQRGLLAALPLPAVGLFDRVLARIHGQLSGAVDLPQHGEAVAGAAALSGTAAASGGGVLAGSSAAVAGAGAVKAVAVACSAAAVTAGVCFPVVQREPQPPAAKVIAAKRSTDRPSPNASAPARLASTTAPETEPARDVTPPTAAPAPARPQKSRGAKTSVQSRRSASPFLPESSAPAPEAAAATPASATAPSASSAPAASTQASQQPPAGDDFSGEFSP